MAVALAAAKVSMARLVELILAVAAVVVVAEIVGEVVMGEAQEVVALSLFAIPTRFH